MSKKITLSFLVLFWSLAGVMLLYKAVVLTCKALESFSLHALLLVISCTVLGAIIGFIKGFFVLGRVANRKVAALLASRPVFTWKDLLLVGGMIGLGVILNRTRCPLYLRLVIDLAVGIALMCGGMTALFAYKRGSIPKKDYL